MIRRPPAAPSTRALFFEPNPRQLQSAAAAWTARPSLRDEVEVAGRIRIVEVDGRRQEAVASARAAVTTPAAPLAPCGWPIIDLVDDPGTRSASAPRAARVQRDSIASFSCVEVP